MMNFENLQKYNFEHTGGFDFPIVQAKEYDAEHLKAIKWIPFNYALSSKKKDRAGKGIHFFIHDYQFIRIWNTPDRYIDLLKDFEYVLTPDFSTYTDMPKALQIYNIYRKQWLGAYWQMHGINVIPTVSWSTADNHEWIFGGIPKNSVLAISSLGCMKEKRSRELFFEGWRRAYQMLEPSLVLCYGKIPRRFIGNVIEMGNFSDEIQERAVKNGR